jgi:hypothetical protein
MTNKQSVKRLFEALTGHVSAVRFLAAWTHSPIPDAFAFFRGLGDL